MEKQEGSDHLYQCKVDCGEEYGHELEISTGAPNAFEGALVPVALDGAVLPGPDGPITIKARKDVYKRQGCPAIPRPKGS